MAIASLLRIGETTAHEAVQGPTTTGTEAAEHGQMTEAIDRWAVRAGEVETQGNDLDTIARIGGRLVIADDEEWP